MKQKMIIPIIIFLLLVLSGCAFTHLPRFGRTPTGERLERVKHSPNYRDGQFQNQYETPQITDNPRKAFFKSSDKNTRPDKALPTIKTDVATLDSTQDILVWFGHSSYYFQIGGKRFLVDPVFSRAASPVWFINRAFKGTDIYDPEDMPKIDFLIITHDHWDHLDYPTVKEMRGRIGKVICPLGVGEHFARWKYDEAKIVEMDWNESAAIDDNFHIHCLPSRHFSGRGLKARQSLWASFLLESSTLNIFIGGDGGYDARFADFGARFDKIDFAMLENGQYNKSWRYIHTSPEETMQAALDMKAHNVIPVHNSKYCLSRHSWYEPMQRIAEINDTLHLQVLTPKIGEVVYLNENGQEFEKWWEKEINH